MRLKVDKGERSKAILIIELIYYFNNSLQVVRSSID
jgi:hypothetical protein